MATLKLGPYRREPVHERYDAIVVGSGIGGLAAEAGERMIRHRIGCLPVVAADGRSVGIMTDEDFLRWAAARMAPANPVRASV